MRKEEKELYENIIKELKNFKKFNKGLEENVDAETLKYSEKVTKETIRVIDLLLENNINPEMYFASVPLILNKLIGKEGYIEKIESLANILITLGIASGKVTKPSSNYNDMYL